MATDDSPVRNSGRGLRYFVDLDIICKRCGLRGHFAWECGEKAHEVRCHLCGKPGHVSRECESVRSCFRCGKTGHMLRDCPEPSDMEQGPARYNHVGVSGGDRGSFGGTGPAAVARPLYQRTGKARRKLEEIVVLRCFVCGGIDHLYCKKMSGQRASHSCYNCGVLGHLGSACRRINADTAIRRARSFVRDYFDLSDGRRRKSSHRMTEDEEAAWWYKFRLYLNSSGPAPNRGSQWGRTTYREPGNPRGRGRYMN
mmetsp:Transcript_3752/g.7166  ORF Transcript_3752/g.7166 Transcript_3752/m.7166 type:complete len:255 (+) Transcript_3752:414-1178(+)